MTDKSPTSVGDRNVKFDGDSDGVHDGDGRNATDDDHGDDGRNEANGEHDADGDAPTEPVPEQSIATSNSNVDVDELMATYRDVGFTVGESGSVDSWRKSPDSSDRGRRLYDSWSGHPRFYDGVMGLTRSMREDTFEALAPESGERILDLACGPGTNFEVLSEGVGPSGVVVGLDFSAGMIERATERANERASVGDRSNVHVVHGDAAVTCGPDGYFDAVLVTFALHTMAAAQTVIENVRDVLRPGGRFVVLDSRPITDGLARYLNPFYERLISWTVDHQRDIDTLALLEATFEEVTVVERYDAGAGYLAVATNPTDA